MITNVSQNSLIARRVNVANTFGARLKGLMGRASIGSEEALVITRCQQIHMFFMRFAIDVIFVDGDNRVVGLVRNIRPYGLSPIFWEAQCAVELAPGAIDSSRTQLGDRLKMETFKS